MLKVTDENDISIILSRFRKIKGPLTLIVGFYAGIAMGNFFTQEDDTFVLVARNNTTIERLAEQLSYEEEELQELNKDIDEKIEKGTNIVISKNALNPVNYRSYTLQENDTLESIGDQFGLTEDTVKAMNPMLKSNRSIERNVGEKVAIYCENESCSITYDYTVVQGDNLTVIAKLLETTVDDIKEQNHLSNDDIFEGQVLKIDTELSQEELEKLKKKEKEIPQQHLEKVEENYGSLKGIDISLYQGEIDFKKVKEQGINFAIIQMYDAIYMEYYRDPKTQELAGKLKKMDAYFEENVRGCEKNNIPYGIYMYSRAVTENQARKEAEVFLEIASEYNIRPTWPIYLDVEAGDDASFYDEDGSEVSSYEFVHKKPNQVFKNFKAWADVLEENGYYCGIYSGGDTLSKIDKDGTKLSDYAVWQASFAYGSKTENSFSNSVIQPPAYSNYQTLQFTQSGVVDGIEGFVDCNYGKVNYHEVIKDTEFNKPLTKKEINKVLTKVR